jgi:hypothetical protein
MSFDDNSDLSKFKEESSNPNTEPSLRFLAAAVLSLERLCYFDNKDFAVIQRLKGIKGSQTYSKVQLLVDSYTFDIYAHRLLDPRRGMSRAYLWVDFHRSGQVIRLTKFGSTMYDDEPSYDDPSKTWQLSLNDLNSQSIVQEVTDQIAQVILSCGLWNSRLMGGLMPGCVGCPYESYCLITSKYLINKKE